MIISSAWYGNTCTGVSLSFICDMADEIAYYEVVSDNPYTRERFESFKEAVKRYKELDKLAKGD